MHSVMSESTRDCMSDLSNKVQSKLSTKFGICCLHCTRSIELANTAIDNSKDTSIIWILVATEFCHLNVIRVQ